MTGNKSSVTLKWLRYLIQSAFLLFIVQLVVKHSLFPEDVFVPSAEAYCPLGGIETLYRFLSTGGKTIPHTHLSNLVVLIALLATVLIAKTAFCGWICPFGTIQEWLRNMGKKLNIAPNGSLYKKLGRWDKYLPLLKYVILGWLLTGTAITGQMVFRDYDPYASLLKIAELEMNAGFIILVIVLIVSLVLERPWCRYFCPLGAVVSILGKLSIINIKRDAGTCSECSICSKNCPAGIDVARADKISSDRCFSCLTCLEKCPRPGALDLYLGGTATAKHLKEEIPHARQ